MPIEISHPQLGEAEIAALSRVLESGQIVGGTEVLAFEEAFGAFCGAKFAVATNSGTAAIESALIAFGIRSGDEVILPGFTFFSTASAVVAVGATPVFADIDPNTYCLAPDAVRAAITPRTVAILPVHLFGHPVELGAFREIAAKNSLALIEDAAQAHGAAWAGRTVGSTGTVTFSFYATKNMTTGEGGIVLTDDAEIAGAIRAHRDHGRDDQGIHRSIGRNYRMTDIAGAIGQVQLARLGEWNDRRRKNAAYYNEHLRGVQTPFVAQGATHVYHQYVIRLEDANSRAEVIRLLSDCGIGSRAYYSTPLHREPALLAAGAASRLPMTETELAATTTLAIPVHPGLSYEDLDAVVSAVNNAVSAF